MEQVLRERRVAHEPHEESVDLVLVLLVEVAHGGSSVSRLLGHRLCSHSEPLAGREGYARVTRTGKTSLLDPLKMS